MVLNLGDNFDIRATSTQNISHGLDAVGAPDERNAYHVDSVLETELHNIGFISLVNRGQVNYGAGQSKSHPLRDDAAMDNLGLDRLLHTANK